MGLGSEVVNTLRALGNAVPVAVFELDCDLSEFSLEFKHFHCIVVHEHCFLEVKVPSEVFSDGLLVGVVGVYSGICVLLADYVVNEGFWLETFNCIS